MSTLVIDRTENPVTADEAPPTSNTAGLIVPPNVKGLMVTVQPTGPASQAITNVTSYNFAVYNTTDDEDLSVDPQVSGFPDGVQWPQISGQLFTRVAADTFWIPVNGGGSKRIAPRIEGIVDTGAFAIVMKARWI